MALHIYNTLNNRKELFEPGDPKRVTMYVCGPTVYNYAHIGNARPAVVFDVLFRLLRLRYGADHVIYARNITDIDDKIIKAAAEGALEWEQIAKKFAKIYRQDMAALGVMSPTIEPKATDYIDQMIRMSQILINLEHAYEADGHVLFDINSYADYGKLSNRDRDEMIAGARVEVAPYKRDPADFVLWKPSSDDQPGWDSPWGRGRPGWHLECSAMIETNLGQTIDIHGGGQDLTFPHHENEIAQSTCAHGGETYCRYWMHNGFLNVNAEKMSKSLGNVLLVHDLVKALPGEVIRYSLLSAQYRQPLDWTDSLIEQSRAGLDRLYQALRGVSDIEADTDTAPGAVLEALEDDLNTPQALAALFATAKALNKAETDTEKARLKGELLAGGALLGLAQQAPEDWFGAADPDGDGLSADAIEAQIQARKDARAARNFAAADKIRDDLAAKGVMLEDKPSGETLWKRG